MAMTDYIIAGVPADAQSSNFTMVGMGNEAQPDIPGLAADEMKAVMDELVRKVQAPAFNAMLSELQGIMTILAPFISTPRSVISDETGAGVQTTDIPDVAALRAAIEAAVIQAGAADMTKAEYASGQETGVVSHAALADTATTATSATSATTATTATNATKLNNQEASYYATATALASTTSQANTNKNNIATLTTKTNTNTSNITTLTNNYNTLSSNLNTLTNYVKTKTVSFVPWRNQYPYRIDSEKVYVWVSGLRITEVSGSTSKYRSGSVSIPTGGQWRMSGTGSIEGTLSLVEVMQFSDGLSITATRPANTTGEGFVTLSGTLNLY